MCKQFMIAKESKDLRDKISFDWREIKRKKG